jgi:hypothetical protein
MQQGAGCPAHLPILRACLLIRIHIALFIPPILYKVSPVLYLLLFDTTACPCCCLLGSGQVWLAGLDVCWHCTRRKRGGRRGGRGWVPAADAQEHAMTV